MLAGSDVGIDKPVKFAEALTAHVHLAAAQVDSVRDWSALTIWFVDGMAS